MKKYKSLELSLSRKQQHASVLLVGDTKLAYTKLLESLKKLTEETRFTLELSRTQELPIAADETGDSLESDLIVILANACDKSSFNHAVKSLSEIPADFFCGHILMLVQKPHRVSDACVEYERFNILAESYMCPVFWDYSDQIENLASQVVAKARIATRPVGVPACLYTGVF